MMVVGDPKMCARKRPFCTETEKSVVAYTVWTIVVLGVGGTVFVVGWNFVLSTVKWLFTGM